MPEPGVGGEEHEWLLEAGGGDLAEEEAVHVEAGIDPAVDEHRRGCCGASEGVAEHADAVEVEDSEERASRLSRSRRVSASSTYRVSAMRTVNAFAIALLLSPTLPIETVWPSGKATMFGVVWVVDRDDHVAVARKVFDEAGVELPFEP